MTNQFKLIKSRKNITDIKAWRERRRKEEEQRKILIKLRQNEK